MQPWMIYDLWMRKDWKGQGDIWQWGAKRQEQMISVHVMKVNWSLPFGMAADQFACLPVSRTPSRHLLFLSSNPRPPFLFRSVAVFDFFIGISGSNPREFGEKQKKKMFARQLALIRVNGCSLRGSGREVLHCRGELDRTRMRRWWLWWWCRKMMTWLKGEKKKARKGLAEWICRVEWSGVSKVGVERE